MIWPQTRWLLRTTREGRVSVLSLLLGGPMTVCSVLACVFITSLGLMPNRSIAILARK